MRPRSERILYASTFEIFRRTWGLKAGGPNSGIFKSTDGGDTWTELTRNPGPAAGDWGRVGLAHSKKKPNRITALIDSKEKNGLYQSEDGGQDLEVRLRSTSTSPSARSTTTTCTPARIDGDELWVLSTSSGSRSTAARRGSSAPARRTTSTTWQFDPTTRTA